MFGCIGHFVSKDARNPKTVNGGRELFLESSGPFAETVSDFADFDLHGMAVAFAALREPFAERNSKARGIDAETGFEPALACWQGLVEFTRAGEIPHAETVQPIERTRAPLAADDDIHLKLSRKHRQQIIAPHREPLGAPRIPFPRRKMLRCLAIPFHVP
jgi:hypothetical protein